MTLTACSAGGGSVDGPARADHPERLSAPRAQQVLDRVGDTVSDLVANGSDGSVFIMEPGEPDLLRVIDAALALQGEGADAVAGVLSAHRGRLLRAGDEDDRHSRWQTARWLAEAPPEVAGRLLDAKSRTSLAKILDGELSGLRVGDPAHASDAALSAYRQLVETASLLNLHDVATKGTARFRARPREWCSELSGSLAETAWQRAAAISELLRTAALKCGPTVSGGRVARRLSGDPTAHLTEAGDEAFSAVQDAVAMAEIRRYLGRPQVPAKGCASLLRTRSTDGILPNVPESLIERCVQISRITGGHMDMSPDIRRVLHRTIDTSGGLPTSLQGDSWSVAFQWDLLRRLGYPRPVADAAWHALIATGPGSDHQADLLLRDVILAPPAVPQARVTALTVRPSGDGGKTLAVAAYIIKTRSCAPRWLSWLRQVYGAAPKRADFDLLSYATAVSARRQCGLRENAAAAAIDHITKKDTVAADEYAFSEEWLKIEARCLAGIPTPRTRLWRDVDAALRPGFINLRRPARLDYAAVRIAEIADRGCTSAWWS